MVKSANPEKRKRDSQQTGEYDEYIAHALATEGGHLSIGRGGATLHFEHGWLSGCREDVVLAEAIAAGLPIIDSRWVPFDEVWALAVRGPMIAVGRPPSPPPYHALSYAPLDVVAEAYRAVGAAVYNLPKSAGWRPSE